jgi:hypothetical protein
MIVDNVVLRPPRLLQSKMTQNPPSHCCASGTAMRWERVFAKKVVRKRRTDQHQARQEVLHTTSAVGQDRGEVRDDSAVSNQTNVICGSQAETQCHQHWRRDGEIEAAGTQSLLQHLLCSSRTSIGKLSERRVSVMHLRSRRVSGAADREQPCGLVVMDGWRRELFAFWVFASGCALLCSLLLLRRRAGGGMMRGAPRRLGRVCVFGWLHAWPGMDSSLRTSGSQPASPSRSNELTVVSYL